jgi:hypothetical protein
VTPILPFTRAVFVLGACLTIGTGIGLFVAPHRTADFWAWEIRSPLSAAFFGAGYIGAAVSLTLAARARDWRCARVVAVAALTLTTLALLATLLHPGPFAFGEGGLAGVAAVIWLVVYVALPLAVLLALAMQRRDRVPERQPPASALPATRLILGAIGALLGLYGIGLLAGLDGLAEAWPWPLPALPAAVTGAWLCTFATGLLWFAVRERDWARVRIGIAPTMLVVALDLIAAARYWDRFDSRGGAVAYVAVLGVLLAVLGGATWLEERRSGEPRPSATSARARWTT